ncbi:MAG TPA: hypothetical protein VFI42_16280, partial [Thermomicrobiaceae bacterium]|nr:hypothetical protein [Thermomicrobiaceae bacterium]
VYKVRYAPVLPHTLPAEAFLTIDRRLLPGDDPAAAAGDIRAAIGDLAPYEVSVSQGVFMLPALVDAEHPGVRALQAANLAVRGQEAEEYYGAGTFDAGGPSAHGIPTVMFGASGRASVTGTDFVPIAAVETEARVLAHLIVSQLGGEETPA